MGLKVTFLWHSCFTSMGPNVGSVFLYKVGDKVTHLGGSFFPDARGAPLQPTRVGHVFFARTSHSVAHMGGLCLLRQRGLGTALVDPLGGSRANPLSV